jgi:torso-like protein
MQPVKGNGGVLMSSTVSTLTSTANSEFSNDKNSNNNNRLTTSHPVIPGSVLHLFQRYGYLSLSMRVVPRNDTQSWVFLEPTKPVFDPSTYEVKEQMFLTPDNGLPLHNEFHIDLCEDIQQLIQAYFRRFTIEGFDKPWHAFAGGWRSPSLAKYMGIDSTYVKGDYKYMLVRVLMVRSTGKFVPFSNITHLHSTDPSFRSLRTNDYTSSYNFFNDVGTHYVNSYLTGNAIYQVRILLRPYVSIYRWTRRHTHQELNLL